MVPLKRFAFKCLSLLSALSLLTAMPTHAKDFGGADFERIISKQYDWIMYCDMDVLDNYMKYKGSQLNPIVRFTVYYKFTGHSRRNVQQMPTVKYEEIWYRDGKAIGLKRFNDINPGYLQQGCLYFRASGDESLCSQDRAMANCAVRLIMDIYVKRSIMAGVIVPEGCFDQFGSDIAYFNFFVLEEASGGKGENMSLHLLSYPRGMDRYYYYDDTGRR